MPVLPTPEPLAYRQTRLQGDPGYRPLSAGSSSSPIEPSVVSYIEPIHPAPSRLPSERLAAYPIVPYSHELTQLDKVYKDEDKFHDTGDNFDFKLAIFYDRCARHGLSSDQYIRAAFIFVSGQALTFFIQIASS